MTFKGYYVLYEAINRGSELGDVVVVHVHGRLLFACWTVEYILT